MTAQQTITPALLRDWPLPEPGASKNARGRVLVVGGSRSTPGAAALAGLAALRVGAGVLALAVPDETVVPLAVTVPEAAVTGWSDSAEFEQRLASADAVVVGPGIDNVTDAARLVRVVAENAAQPPVVLDAFALGALADVSDAARALAGRLVLTPNHAEAGALLDAEIEETADIDQAVGVACRIAAEWDAVVSMYGAVATPSGSVYRPSTAGTPGLGTSGSGDVLAGALCGLLARGAELDQATCWASYLHAASGDRLAARIGRLGFLARELLDELPLVVEELSS
ncbi:MAG TPA: NAD(P)H-hydrate dehydratase [Jatrophihabitantaceae bacterium]|nr:NAD(P)H-hydrate dehydratase [Jatrophihabitantaceae bacterium]